uniref:(northern house mosquito) hypothetical protein n=1 Tax=Culex pipiens TaxID=7175 RepID=A0A8D8BZF0_CULPI
MGLFDGAIWTLAPKWTPFSTSGIVKAITHRFLNQLLQLLFCQAIDVGSSGVMPLSLNRFLNTYTSPRSLYPQRRVSSSTAAILFRCQSTFCPRPGCWPPVLHPALSPSLPRDL